MTKVQTTFVIRGSFDLEVEDPDSAVDEVSRLTSDALHRRIPKALRKALPEAKQFFYDYDATSEIA